MAIVEMKRLTLLAPKADRERLLKALQKMGCVEIAPPDPDTEAFCGQEATGAAETEAQLQRLSWALGQLRKYDKAPKPSFGTYPEISQAEAESVFQNRARYEGLIETLEGFARRKGELNSLTIRAQNAFAQYIPWSSMEEAPKAALADTARVVYLAGTVPISKIKPLEDELAALQYAPLTEIGAGNDSTACIIVAAHREVEKEARAALEKADFTLETFDALGDMTPIAFLEAQEAFLREMAAEREKIEEQTAKMTEDIQGLKILHEILAMELQRRKAAEKFAVTETTFLCHGWVPAEAADKLTAKVKKISPASAMEIREPFDDEEPPVKLKNGPFVTPFETVVEGFSLPAYRSIDPTAVMAPFYACLFGMMVSDAGYGLLMVLLIPLFILYKKIKPENGKILYLLTFGGVATVIWGLIYNTVFGFNPLPEKYWLLDSMNNSLPVMGVCAGVGALHLFAGLGVGAYMSFKRGQPLAAFADYIAWGTLIIGLGLLFLPSAKMVSMVLIGASLLLILLFTKRGERNPFKRIIGGLSALYGITGWLSDLLSYMRLFGMGLATGIIGMVFNQLIGMVWGAGIAGKILAPILFVACHLFNLGINALGAYVHSCRLQYIEFFGKFYEDGGRPFSPLKAKPKYVSIKTANADE